MHIFDEYLNDENVDKRERAKLWRTSIGFQAVDNLTVSYGAQNEAYMSRSAEKWVRGLCFNELGVGG